MSNINNIDPALMMFISACCARCPRKDCDGALEIASRLVCKKYRKWLTLPPAARTKLFTRALTGEFINLEKLIDESTKY